jgi:hypothetical protein
MSLLVCGSVALGVESIGFGPEGPFLHIAIPVEVEAEVEAEAVAEESLRDCSAVEVGLLPGLLLFLATVGEVPFDPAFVGLP